MASSFVSPREDMESSAMNVSGSSSNSNVEKHSIRLEALRIAESRKSDIAISHLQRQTSDCISDINVSRESSSLDYHSDKLLIDRYGNINCVVNNKTFFEDNPSFKKEKLISISSSPSSSPSLLSTSQLNYLSSSNKAICKVRVDWDHLLCHIMNHIFFHLEKDKQSKNDNISSLRLTSKSCYYAASAIFHSLKVSHTPVGIVLASLNTSFVNVTSLKLFKPVGIIPYRLSFCTKLTSLTIESTDMSFGAISHLVFIGKLKKLTHLRLRSPKALSAAAIHALSGLSKLKSLSLGSRLQLAKNTLCFLTNFVDLEYLELRGTDAIDDEGIKIFTRLNHLTTLVLVPVLLSNNTYTKKGMGYVSQIKSLTHIALHSCHGLSTNFIDALNHLPRLSFLKLKQCQDMCLYSTVAFENMARLTSLKLLDCDHIADEAFEALERMSTLRDLQLGNCLHVTDSAMNSIRNIKNLIHLKLIK